MTTLESQRRQCLQTYCTNVIMQYPKLLLLALCFFILAINRINYVDGFISPNNPLLSNSINLQFYQKRQQQHEFEIQNYQGLNRRTFLSETVVPTNDEGSSTSTGTIEVLSKLPDMEAYSNGYKTRMNEVSFQRCIPTTGKVPNDLVGTYFRSGPAMFSAGSIVPPKTSIVQPRQPPVPDSTDSDRMVRHPFEGDGAIVAITFGPESSNDERSESIDSSPLVSSSSSSTTTSDMEVSMRYRFVRTIGFTAERKKGARSYKGMDITRNIGAGIGNDMPIPAFRHHLLPGLNKYRKNTSNTRAIFWGKRLFSMWESGLPYKLDARACDTEGKSRFGGAVQRDEDPLGGRMVVDSVTNRAIFYGIQHGIKSSKIITYEFDSSFKLLRGGRIEFDVPGFALLTDFAVTSSYVVFVQPDVSVRNSIEYTIGSKDPGTALTIGNGPAQLHLLPRLGSNKQQKTIKIPIDKIDDALDINVHFINAFESIDKSEVTIDLIRSSDKDMKKGSTKELKWPWGRTLDEYQSYASKKSLWRYIVNVSAGTIQKQLLTDQHCYFGTINQQRSAQSYNYIYMNVGSAVENNKASPPQGIAKYSTSSFKMDVWMPQPYEFCGEPLYARRELNGNDGGTTNDDKDSDDGYVLSILYNGKIDESELIILNANNIASGPICRIPLGIAIPHGHFGCYESGVIWSSEEIERRAKLSDKIESKGNRWNEVKSDFSGLGLRFDDMEEYFGDFFSG
jgi:all-trans-8'-apo-beta-carotenal 15,15'-oxygenase